MLTSPDFRELLKIFKKHKIRYLIKIRPYPGKRSERKATG